MHSILRRSCLVLLVAPVLLLAVACADGDDGSAGDGLSGTLTVFAAASLRDSFDEIAAAFEAEHPGLDVQFNFAGTPTLRTQLEQGATADVFASANPEQMQLAVDNGVIEGETRTFARNSLVIITPAANPAGIQQPSDLARDGLKLIVAQENVPVGGYTLEALSAMEADEAFGGGFQAAVLENVISLESNVKQVVAKVELGEADAGIVYGTDVTPSVAGALEVVEIPEEFNVIAEYPIGRVASDDNDEAAEAFIEFVLSDAGQAILDKYNFRVAWGEE